MTDVLIYGKENTKRVPITIHIEEWLVTIAQANNVNLSRTLEKVLMDNLPKPKIRLPPKNNQTKKHKFASMGRPPKLTGADESRIVSFIGLEGKWSDDICTIARANRNTTTRFLADLIKKGLIESPARGFYRIPKKEESGNSG